MSEVRNHYRERRRNVTPVGGTSGAATITNFGSSQLVHVDTPVTFFTKEFMTDTHGFKDNDFNPCFHDKLNLYGEAIQREVTTSTEDGVTIFSFISETEGISPDALRDTLRTLHESQSGLKEHLDDAASYAHLHIVKTADVSALLINFVKELKESAEDAVKSLERIVSKKVFKAQWESLQRYKKRKYGSRYRAPKDPFPKQEMNFLDFFTYVRLTTGSYWLAWNFAIKPTLKDISAIMGAWGRATKRIAWLREHNRMDTKVRYRHTPYQNSGEVVFAPIWPVQTAGLPYTLPEDVVYVAKYAIEVSPSFWAYVRFDLADFMVNGDFTSVSMMWAQAMGLFDPLMVVWEAIPFSWLVDWFRSARDNLMLRYKGIGPFKDARIVSEGHSTKTIVVGQLYLRYPGIGGLVERQVGEFEYSLFVRSPGPLTVDSLPFRIPYQWYNISILSGIMAQKRRH